MEETEDMFADLLSGLEPKSTQEPPPEPYVSMEESRRQAVSNTVPEPEPVRVRQSNSPVGENLSPPPPPISKAEMQQLIQENVRELLFQNFGALTTTLSTVLKNLRDRVSVVEGQYGELNTKFDTFLTKHGADSEKISENFRHVETTLKEVSVGIQRMLEKQDLMDAHILLNRHAREERADKKQDNEETQVVNKSEKRVTTVRKESTEEMAEEEDEEGAVEEENPPPARLVPKKKLSPKPQPTANYVHEQKPTPVEPEPYSQEDKVMVKHSAPVYEPTQMPPLQRPSGPNSYVTETAQPQPTPPPPQQLSPVQHPIVHPRPPQQLTPSPSPQQASFPPGSETMGYKATPPPSYDYARQGMGNPNGYAPSPEKPPLTSHPQHMPLSNTVPFSGFPSPPIPGQQPPIPVHPGPPGPYTGYPSLPGQQPPYRTEQPPPPPPSQQVIYGSPAAIQAGSKSDQRHSDPVRPSPHSIPLDQVITDVANMGFDRTKVRSVVTNMLDHGEAVDLNVVIDRLTNMRY